ncbi:hypothetical protein ACTRXD_07805 [Nitrospira sp. T9]|uniref:hypothetical protein n=1 Tax=unclassified Nitrospira TaxID=2652172 RepID=UPI003F9CD785
MALSPDFITTLTNGLTEYYDQSELERICKRYAVSFSADFDQLDILAESLIVGIDNGRNRNLLKVLVQDLCLRSSRAVARTDWERRDYHSVQFEHLGKLAKELEAQHDSIPTEVSVAAGKPFAAKTEVRELLASATTRVTVVDNYVDHKTLDCFRDTAQPIRLLTGTRKEAIKSGFDSILQDFRNEGYSIEIRRHPELHDRHILFNDRCWMVGSSLKDAGKKPFNLIEVINVRAEIEADVERKWQEGEEYPGF